MAAIHFPSESFVLAVLDSEVASSDFSVLNWMILAVFLIGTTVLGERLNGMVGGLDGFSRGSKNLPWRAVGLSLIATKTSVATFTAVPAFVFSAKGDLTYLQMTIGLANQGKGPFSNG